MKALVFLLVLVNVLFYAFSAGYFGGPQNPDAHRVEQQLMPERMRIVSRGEAPKAPAGPPAPTVPAAEGTETKSDAPAASTPRETASTSSGMPRWQLLKPDGVIAITGNHEYYGGYDAWVAHANNASFALQAAYDEWVPGFEALFAQQGRDWPRFHAAVQQLAALPAAERDAQLRALTAVQVRD